MSLRHRELSVSVILSAAKDLMPAATGGEVLRYAQDDKWRLGVYALILGLMNWRLLTWKDFLGVVFVAALAGAILLYYIEHPNMGRPARLDAIFGFGPDWICKDVGKGDPVCVKKQPAN